MTNQEKLKQAVELLAEVSENWDNDNVIYYPNILMSFDELVTEIASIELRN